MANHRVAFVFTQSPHGSSAGREGLDAVMATSALSDEIALFFISDGVMQLLPAQQPEKVLARNYITTFGVLPLYDIDQFYLCETALEERGIAQDTPFVLPVTVLSPSALRQKLDHYDRVLTF